jgi:hypothetical protein
MPDPLVWSERGEAPGTGGLNDCTYCANLMVLVAAGKASFPLGIYTRAERDQLETLNANPDDEGANHGFTDTAIRNRYGITMRKLANGTRDRLRDELSKKGRAYAVAGRCEDRPSRLQLTGCTGAHDVCLVPQGDGNVLWLDPMEPMRTKGKVATVQEVLDYAFFPSGGNDARFLNIGELASQEEMMDPTTHIPVAVCSVAGGGTVYADPERGTILIQSWVGQSTVGLYARVDDPSADPAPLVPIRIEVSGILRVGWVGVDKVSNIRLPGT